MEEGEVLSRKQMQQEQTIRKLRAQVKELQTQVRQGGWGGGWEVGGRQGGGTVKAVQRCTLWRLRCALGDEGP